MRASILAHREPVVIAAFVDHWDVSAAEADALFEDVMAWLWLATRPDAPPLGLAPPMRIVDEMWHELIVHTAIYRALCEEQLGRFVHHAPDAASDAPPVTRAVYEAQWRYIAEQLGVDRLLRWYVELPLRHDDAWFRRGRRAIDLHYTPSPALIAKWQARRGAAR